MLICSLIAGIVGHGYDSVGATEKECACSGIIVSGIIAEFGDTSSGPGSYVSAFYVEMQQTVDRCKPHTALAVGDYLADAFVAGEFVAETAFVNLSRNVRGELNQAGRRSDKHSVRHLRAYGVYVVDCKFTGIIK